MRLLFTFLLSVAVSQLALAKSSLTSSTRQLLKNGSIFKLRPSGEETASRLAALQEIYSSPSLIKEALDIVATEHGSSEQNRLSQLLKNPHVTEVSGSDLLYMLSPISPR